MMSEEIQEYLGIEFNLDNILLGYAEPISYPGCYIDFHTQIAKDAYRYLPGAILSPLTITSHLMGVMGYEGKYFYKEELGYLPDMYEENDLYEPRRFPLDWGYVDKR
jgi:hypothetical protein